MIKIILILLSISFHTHAETFKLKQGTIKMDVPSGWEEAKNLFGVQLMLLGPMKGDRRPVITIESVQLKSPLSLKGLKSDEANYRNYRQMWLKKKSGKLIEFIPYTSQKLNSNKNDHSMGFRYILGAHKFSEVTHYLTCHKILFNFKVLSPLEEEAMHKSVIHNILNSFVCPQVGQK